MRMRTSGQGRVIQAAGVLISIFYLCSLLPVQAREAPATTTEGCSIVVRKPVIVDAALIGRARLWCTNESTGRKVMTELIQRRDDGTFAPVPGTRRQTEASEATDGHVNVDSIPARCRPIEGNVAFRTVVTIQAPPEPPTHVASKTVSLPQDCFGGTAPTLRSPDNEGLAACTVPPLSDEAIAASFAAVEQWYATAVAATPVSEISAGRVPFYTPTTIPTGPPADPTVAAAITDLEIAYVACYNAGEVRRAAALLAGDVQAVFLYMNLGRTDDPSPLPEDQRLPSPVVSDVSKLPGGQIGAVVYWDNSPKYDVYEQVDGHWRIVAATRIKED